MFSHTISTIPHHRTDIPPNCLPSEHVPWPGDAYSKHRCTQKLKGRGRGLLEVAWVTEGVIVGHGHATGVGDDKVGEWLSERDWTTGPA